MYICDENRRMIVSARKTRKQELEQKAASLFRERGYAATSMRDLAQHLGIEAASLYSHIKSKEELLHKTCFELAEAMFQSLDALNTLDLTASDLLKQALKNHLALISSDTDKSMVFLHEYRHLSEPGRSQFLKMRKDYEQRFMLIIRSGIRNGEFRKVDEKITTLALLSAVNSTPVWLKKGSGMKPEALSDMLSDILINGLSSKQAENSNVIVTP